MVISIKRCEAEQGGKLKGKILDLNATNNNEVVDDDIAQVWHQSLLHKYILQILRQRKSLISKDLVHTYLLSIL